MDRFQKNQAKDLFEKGGLKKALYDKLLKLELDDYEAGEEKDTEGPSEGNKIEFAHSGIAIDPKKKTLGAFVELEDDEEDNGRRSIFQRSRMFIQRRQRMRKRARRFINSDDEEEEEDENEKKDVFNPMDYY